MDVAPVDRGYLEKDLEYFGHVRKEIFPLLPRSAGRVLEIGCGTGDTLAYLKQTGKSDWVAGVELAGNAAAIARNKLDLLIEGNIETIQLPIEEGTVDVLLCLDVLEHLVDPWTVVRKLAGVLRPGGVLIASIPNVRHFRVVFPLLLKGAWPYSDSGILDRTHLRFFTRGSALELISASGLRVEVVHANGLEKGTKARFANALTLGLLRPFFETQYLISARKFLSSIKT